MIWPASPVLNDVRLFGGLAVFSGYMLFDTQRVRRRAQEGTDREYDSMKESVDVYLNIVNIFVRFVVVLMKREEEKKKEEDRRRRAGR